MANVTKVSHPLIDHSLTTLRERKTTTAEFRQHASIVSKILLLEATKELELDSIQIETPLCSTTGKRLKQNVVLIPVLRAGLAMLFAAQEFMPQAPVGFLGLERDEKTAQAREYYQKIPALSDAHRVILLDPMLATGGSLHDAIVAVQKRGAQQISIVTIISAPEGITRLNQAFPKIQITTAGIDTSLNQSKFIVPGLGDFGDRYFAT